MEMTLQTIIWLPIGLGLLGFIEPCTIGGHLLFLNTQASRNWQDKITAVTVFVISRAIVTGLFGALVAFVGSRLIELQTQIWLVFGLIYLAVGLFFLFGASGLLKISIILAPDRWKQVQKPMIMGLAFGANIPACAAPILFGLLGMAASTGSILVGFFLMFLFGIFLSLPLVVFVIFPSWQNWLGNLATQSTKMHWFVGILFVGLGIWSIWFGFYVDPAKWAGT